MPIREYFGGHGEEVARKMRQRYGDRWQRVFYATANARGLAPRGGRRRSSRGRRTASR